MRAAELEAEGQDSAWYEPTDAELGELSGHIRDTLAEADPAPSAKALVKALVAEVRVESRDAIWPMFRVPTTPRHAFWAVWWAQPYSARNPTTAS